jgi:hypothetical protein
MSLAIRALTRPSHTGTKIDIVNGREGPKHDPYSYEEITIERRGWRVTMHLGLAEWIEFQTVEGKRDSARDLLLAFDRRAMAKRFDNYRPEQLEKNERRLWATVGLNPAAFDLAVQRQKQYDAEHYVEDPMGCLADYE